ncbi:phBC6A51 family helix-turn-helix protein [Paenibacillus sp. TRM 82003]|nr:phBC6A51 family helix-turn-helix protein [Paenibacillus sp. TRM 82003]
MRLIKAGELTAEQLHAIEILALPKRGNMTYEEVAEAVGVSSKTLQRWRKETAFQEAVRRRSLQLLGEQLPDVLEAILNGALRGSAKHSELILKSLHVLKENHVIEAKPYEPDERSNEAIEEEIARLQKELDEIGGYE